MRHALTFDCDARIVIGGRTKEYTGYAPGIIEELLLSFMAGKKVLLSTALGGACEAAVNLDSRPAIEIRNDAEHPMAWHAVQTVQNYATKRQLAHITSNLHTEAILPTLAGILNE
jgi:hypothetical protein